MFKGILTFLIIFFSVVCHSQTFPLRIESENYSSQSGSILQDCSEGGSSMGFMNEYDYLEYQVTLPKDSIYRLSVRAAGAGKCIWVTDSVYKVLGKVYYSWTLSDQTYTTASTYLFLKGGNRKIRLLMLTSKTSINWVEITPSSGLYSANYFESDWQWTSNSFGSVAWKSCRADSINSTTAANGWIKQTARATSLLISNEFPYDGSSSARFELSKSDSSTAPYLRSEIYKGPAAPDEAWLGFSFMSTTDITNDALPHIVYQAHGTDDPARDGHPAEAKSPNIALRIENDSMYVKVLWCAAAYSSDATKDGEIVYNVGKYEVGVWSRWVFHIKYAYNNTGILEVWRDGSKLVNRINLPNAYNDLYWSYFKFGIYKWGWVNPWFGFSPYNTVVVYFDNLKIGCGTSNFAEVGS